jgi:hypothetical protein
MARVHFVKKAAKDNKAAGVKKGDSYYWWANRMPGSMSGVKRYSKTPPLPWQTMPPGSFRATVGELEHRLQDFSAGEATGEDGVDALRSHLEEIAGEVRELADEQDEKFTNMPDGLQQGDTGQLLEGRAQSLNDWADAIEAIDLDGEDLESAVEELQSCSYEGE